MDRFAYVDTSFFVTFPPRRGREQYHHASGLLIITPTFDEVLLVQRGEWISYGGNWSIPGGYRLQQQGLEPSLEPVLEPSLECAVAETIEEIGGVPKGKIRSTPHRIVKPAGKLYETFVLEVDPKERRKFRPSLDYSEVESWAWQPTEGIAERPDVHPGLRQFFREYRF